MDRREDLKSWFHKMGYDDKKFPKNISKFCNNSNVFVWEQLMEYVRPLSEVENIKKQILISQLSNKSLDELQNLKYSSKEVELYLRKKELQEKLTFVRYSMNQKENLSLKLQEENKNSSFSLQKINLEIEDNEQREYMLREKMKLLSKERQFAESVLENLHVPSLMNSGNSNEITRDLSELKKKLQTDIEELQLPTNNDETICTINKLLMSSKKNSRCSSTISNFNSNIKQKFTSNTKRRTAKLPQTFVHQSNKVTKCLFPDNNHSVMNSMSNHDTISDFPTPSMHLGKSSPRKCTLNEGSFIKRLSSLSTANEIKHLMNKYNREDIWNVIQSMNNNLHLNILFKTNSNFIKSARDNYSEKEELARLQSLHAETEFKNLQQSLILKQWKMKLHNKKNDIINQYKLKFPNKDIENVKQTLEYYIEHIRVVSSNKAFKQEITDLQKNENVSFQSNRKADLLEIERKLKSKREAVIQHMGIVYDLLDSFVNSQIALSSTVRKLNPYISNVDEMFYSLRENITVEEIKIFKEVPLEFNRKPIGSVPINRLLRNIDSSSKEMALLNQIMDNPFMTQEMVVLGFIRQMRKLKDLQSIKYPRENSIKTHSLEELQREENRMKDILERLNNLLFSAQSCKFADLPAETEKTIDLWIKMPFKDCIPPTKIADGKNYKHYEEQINFYKAP